MRPYIAFSLAIACIVLGLLFEITYWSIGVGLAAVLLATLDLNRSRGTQDSRRLGCNWSTLVCGGLGIALALV